MHTDEVLKGDKVTLRIVELSDCNDDYFRWLNDKETNKYLETRWNEQTHESIKNFVETMRDSDNNYLFAIIYENKHVGNIKIGPIHPIYKFADLSYFIGEKKLQGKGIVTDAIHLAVKFAFEKLNLHRLEAYVIEGNVGSQKVLIKNGFKLEAVCKKKTFLNIGDEYIDAYWYAILKEDWLKDNS